MRKIINNKRGDIFQVPVLIIILLVASMIGLIFYKISKEITEEYDNLGILNDTEEGQEANQMIRETAKHATNELIILLFLGAVIALLISAAKTNFSAMIIFMFLILLILSVFIASGATNIYQGLAASPALSEEAAELTMANIVWSKYTPLFICVIGGLILIIMYSKSGMDITK